MCDIGRQTPDWSWQHGHVDVTIRLAVATDHDAISDVFARASLGNEGDRDNLLAHPELLEFDADVLDRDGTRVATVDAAVVGFATLRRTSDQAGELDDLFVDPDWMRRGIARALIGELIDDARRAGLARIEVTANGHAMGFYDSAGFIADGTAATAFGVATHMHLDIS